MDVIREEISSDLKCHMRDMRSEIISIDEVSQRNENRDDHVADL